MQNPSQPSHRQRVLSHALALAFGALLLSPPAWSQSNATGTVYGQAPAGSQLLLINPQTGTQRQLTLDAQGRYLANSVPPGQYILKLIRDGKTQAQLEVEARVGTGVEASFTTQQLDTVLVQGKTRSIDVSNTNNGVVLTTKQLEKMPVARDIASVMQLAPGVTRNTNSQYGNAASFNGAGASENAFYVNGFPITNLLTQVGSAELPFGAISNVQLLSGGYSAEFGRSTGGVVNITTKSGSNKFEVGGRMALAPAAWRARPEPSRYPQTGANPETDGKPIFKLNEYDSTARNAGLYASGPLIRNQLFAFAALEGSWISGSGMTLPTELHPQPDGTISHAASSNRTQTRRLLTKLDYHPADDHHFEYTWISDQSRTRSKSYALDPVSLARRDTPDSDSLTENCCGASAPGQQAHILKYTGYLSEDLTVTALLGRSKTRHLSQPGEFDDSLRNVYFRKETQAPGLQYFNPQAVGGELVDPASMDSQRVLRLDAEYKLGAHALRAGVDRIQVRSIVGTRQPGGGSWIFNRGDANSMVNIPGALMTPAQGGGLGKDGYWVSEYIAFSHAEPSSTQSALYIQDQYQVTKHLMLDLGLRKESFTNYNSSNQPFIAQHHQIAPRLGAAWDFNGDGSLKLFANAGRYHLPVPSNLASNLASPRTSTQRAYTYTGLDPVTGAPVGLNAIGKTYSASNEYGTARDARTITAIDLKPLYQDELSFGFEKALDSGFNIGAQFLARTLRSTNDDTCDQRPIDAWAAAKKIELGHDFHFDCTIINPGQANSVWIDPQGDGKLVRADLPADAWGSKVKRQYRGLTLFAERPFRDGWYGKLTYTYSRLRGNSEGQVDSINGGDVGLTVTSDLKELSLNADGWLANDHRHQIKAYGYYQLTPEFIIGANASLTSGKPRNCMGNLPDGVGDEMAQQSGYVFYFCEGKPAPRGSMGRAPWQRTLDLSFSYRPAALPGFKLQWDLYNAFNSQRPTAYVEARERLEYDWEKYAWVNAINNNYGQIAGRTSPRTLRVSAEFNTSF